MFRNIGRLNKWPRVHQFHITPRLGVCAGFDVTPSVLYVYLSI